MRILFFIALLITFIPYFAQADELPSSVAEIIQEAKLECNDLDDGEFHSTDKAVIKHDFTGDGKPEELIDSAQFSCSTAATLWGGSGGTYLWIVAPDKTYEFLAHRWKVIDFNGQSVLLLAVHSFQCGDGVGPCFRAFVWQDSFRTTKTSIEF